jgi:glycolate oxidase iron-sulfur subunit
LVTTQLQNTLASEEQKLLACIHCGLCLEACPTYVITGDENDGPRGRLYLMRAVGEGRLNSESKSFKTHIDRCLGCRACEQVCPAGVEYGQLLEAARAEIVTSNPDKGFANALFRFMLRHVWLHPSRLRIFFAATRLLRDSRLPRALIRLRLARLVSKRMEFALALLENSRSTESIGVVYQSPAGQTSAGSVSLFKGCVGEGLFGHVNRATVRVLQANGFSVEVPQEQVCCGALHAHAGDLEGARDLARKNVQCFGNGATAIITNAGGCGAMLVSYGHLLANTELAAAARELVVRVKDVGQQLQSIQMKRGVGANGEFVTYDASCHLLYGQHAADSSKAMLLSIENIKFTELKGSERCCGAAGVYNLLQPELSGGVLQEKLKNVADSGAEVVTTGNPGCQMQIGAGACLAGMNLRVRHPVELLDEAYERAAVYSNNKANRNDSQA